jgi:hypothetical protein
MELQRLQEVKGGMSVGERIEELVKKMQPEARLDAVMKWVGMGLEAEERLQEVVVEAWETVLKNKWWKARYKTLEEFKAGSGVADGVAEVMRARRRTESRKQMFARAAARRWGGLDVRMILGGGLMPESPSKRFLEAINTLAGRVPNAKEALELLKAGREERLRRRGTIKAATLQISDVNAALKGLEKKRKELESGRSGDEKRRRVMNEEEEEEEEEEEGEGDEEDGEEWEGAGEREGGCGCVDVEETVEIVQSMKGLAKNDLKGRVEVLRWVGRKKWEEMCHRHVRRIASGWELQTSRLKRVELIERVMGVQANENRLEELVGDSETHLWFRKKGRPLREEDELGPFKYVGMGEREFKFCGRSVWERYGGVGLMEKFLESGNVVVSGVFDWIVKDVELMGMVDAEFEMYRHHLREQNGKANYGWCRNMWHSLVQQVMRQDPVFYGLNVAARGDGNWRLVSFPYYTKYAMPGDATGFKHIDINIGELLKSGRGGSMVQTGISLDEEFSDGCTMVVPGFHRQIGEWWGLVQDRRKGGNGLVQRVEDLYTKEDSERYGEFVPVVCSVGDVRMTMGSMIHGSTGGCIRRRRVVHPWLVGVNSDHDGLEIGESGSWEEVSRAHRNMWAMKVGATGKHHMFGVGSGRFAGCVEIRGVSGLGDALVGGRRWDSGVVVRERDAVLGRDMRVAWGFVEGHRWRMRQAWRVCFKEMVELEKREFGEKSYFRLVEERGNIDLLAEVAGM